MSNALVGIIMTLLFAMVFWIYPALCISRIADKKSKV